MERDSWMKLVSSSTWINHHLLAAHSWMMSLSPLLKSLSMCKWPHILNLSVTGITWMPIHHLPRLQMACSLTTWTLTTDNMPLDDQDLQIPSGCGTTPLENLENFQGPSWCYPHGMTFMDQFFLDKYGKLHKDNIFYPFTSQKNWQITSWLLCSHLSMAAINSFLSLDLVRYIYLSFSARNWSFGL